MALPVCCLAAAIVAALTSPSSARAHSPAVAIAVAQRRVALPEDPATAIVAAFQDHQIVALGEGAHGNEQGHRFRLALIRDPRFAAVINDIVVESGNSRFQPLMDRYISGEAFDDTRLEPVWRDSTQINGAFERTIVPELFKEVRALNASLPQERRLRVLLGDPPVDWTRTDPTGIERIRQQMKERSTFAAQLISREVLAKKRKALLIWGDGHIVRTPNTLVSLLEARNARVFAVSTAITARDVRALQDGMRDWPVPSLARVEGTVLGATPLREYFYFGEDDGALEQRVDAVLYMGARASITFATMVPTFCAAQNVTRRLSRLALFPELMLTVGPSIERACAVATP